MRFVPPVIAALLLLAGTGAQAQYKCVRNGAVTFQQAPCASADEGHKLDLRVAPPADPGDAAVQRKARADLADIDRRLAIRIAIESGRPALGMTRDELDLAMGTPVRTGTSSDGAKAKQRLTYRRDGRNITVTLRDGVVTDIDEGASSSAAAKPSRPCPSAREIRDIEMDISKFENRGNARVQARLHKQLEDARACR